MGRRKRKLSVEATNAQDASVYCIEFINHEMCYFGHFLHTLFRFRKR